MPIYDTAGGLRRPRIPVLGKIRLGERRQSQRTGVDYPVATDHFVLRDARPVAEVFGEEPRELAPVVLPVDDEEVVASHYYRAYTATWGLTCRGNGLEAQRLVDRDALEAAGGVIDPAPPLAGSDTRRGAMITVPCPCPLLQTRQCNEVMYLRIMLPTVPGLGVWQISTRSYHSIQNIRGALAMIRAVAGRISGVPLRLSLVPMDITALEAGGKKTVHVLRLDLHESWTPAQMLRWAQSAPAGVLLPPPDESEPDDAPAEGEIAGLPEEAAPPEQAAEEPAQEQRPGWYQAVLDILHSENRDAAQVFRACGFQGTFWDWIQKGGNPKKGLERIAQITKRPDIARLLERTL